ncbi:hypothetical protein RBU49_10965 [Clostridium sp. MB40-C1]|uniref:hypothetical protein n=1 Tax=Clostridium sp. MB40-C1 TaxID=3070996 RepID=UPI0027E0598C|nr:hypothetical protein [Clostridium sp. MB40-C1]WMJ79411.1 hypothetical protein RBU49_10965 [Clostridium sp. MB40-C1]
MNNKNDRQDLNPIENQIKEIENDQKNAYNPGYYIQNGNIPLFIKNLVEFPLVLLILGIIILTVVIINIINNNFLDNIAHNTLSSIIVIMIFIRGLKGLLKNHKNNK